MANVLINESSMTAIANAIRTKKGVSTTYKPSEMADAISSISTGGITPTGTKSITANGTYDVTNFASAEVNVPTGGVTPTGTKEISITQNGTTTEDVTNYASAQITVNVQGGGGDPNENLLKLATNTLTSVTLDVDGATVKERLFNTSSSLLTLKLLNIASMGSYVAYNCSKLTTAVMTAKTSSNLPQYTFMSCPKLATVDLSDLGIRDSCFASDALLTTLILRKSTVAWLEHINAFANTMFASGKSGGTLYVPQALISSYQSDSKWSVILGYENNSILPIEGSIYETQYADGTPISA